MSVDLTKTKTGCLGKWHITARICFRWYDLWVGAYWDGMRKILYICPLPCLVLELWFTSKANLVHP